MRRDQSWDVKSDVFVGQAGCLCLSDVPQTLFESQDFNLEKEAGGDLPAPSNDLEGACSLLPGKKEQDERNHLQVVPEEVWVGY